MAGWEPSEMIREECQHPVLTHCGAERRYVDVFPPSTTEGDWASFLYLAGGSS